MLLAARGMSSLTVRGVLRKSSQNDKQTSAPGVAAYLLANGEVAVALEALISQGALGDCIEGLPASCAFEGLVITGLGWPCASEPCAQRHLSGVASKAGPKCSKHGLPAMTEDAV